MIFSSSWFIFTDSNFNNPITTLNSDSDSTILLIYIVVDVISMSSNTIKNIIKTQWRLGLFNKKTVEDKNAFFFLLEAG